MLASCSLVTMEQHLARDHVPTRNAHDETSNGFGFSHSLSTLASIVGDTGSVDRSAHRSRYRQCRHRSANGSASRSGPAWSTSTASSATADYVDDDGWPADRWHNGTSADRWDDGWSADNGRHDRNDHWDHDDWDNHWVDNRNDDDRNNHRDHNNWDDRQRSVLSRSNGHVDVD